MTTSNSSNFSMNRDEIILDALENIGALSPGETAKPEDITTCSRKMNMMVKGWMAQGIHLWALEEATLFLSVGTKDYLLGSTGAHCTNDYVHTTLSTDEALGSTSLGITSASGMSASDNIGIVLNDGSIHWTTISGAPGSTTIIAVGLAGSASAGNVVFAYTTKIDRPQRIISALRRNIANNDAEVRVISRKDYSDLSSKYSIGKSIQIFYDPQLVNGVLSVWPSPDSSTDVIRFWYSRIIQDFDSMTNTPDFPIEWAEALSAGLSYRISIPYGVPPSERNELKENAITLLDIAMSYDQESTSVMFQPEIR